MSGTIHTNSRVALMPRYRSNVYCDSCMKTPFEHRIICLECVDPKTFWGQVDLCSDCLDMSVTTHELDHTPYHYRVKITYFLHDREKAAFLESVLESVDRAKTMFDEPTKSEGICSWEFNDHITKFITAFDGKNPVASSSKATCCACEKPVTIPCWLCTACCESVEA